MTLLIGDFSELWLYWTVTLLNCDLTELWLDWTLTLLNYYFTELLLYWTVTLLNYYFTELLLHWTITLLNFKHFLKFVTRKFLIQTSFDNNIVCNINIKNCKIIKLHGMPRSQRKAFNYCQALKLPAGNQGLANSAMTSINGRHLGWFVAASVGQSDVLV